MTEPTLARRHPPNFVMSWLADPDHHECLATRPTGAQADVLEIIAAVRTHAATRPRLFLGLIGTWLLVVLAMQLVLQPDVARIVWPLSASAIAGCVVGIHGLTRRWMSIARGWQVVSVTSCIQAMTFVLGYFLTDFSVYQTALVVEVLAVAVLDVRGRAIQLMVVVVIGGWGVGTGLSPSSDETIWSIMVMLGACSAALVAHHITMRMAYSVKWLRNVDDRRVRELHDAFEASQLRLRALRRAERKLERTIGQLKEAQVHLGQAHKLEAIGQLAAGVAHEINTPTQYVSDNTTFLQGAFDKLLAALAACRVAVEPVATPDAELARVALKRARVDYHLKQVPRAIEQSLDGLSRIASLVAALKEFSHPSGGIKAAVDLNQAIQTTITIARNEWKYVAEVTTDLDPALPPVWCLQDELNQVVLNMIVNAAHAIGEQAHDGAALGKISVRTRCTRDHAVIEIADDGAGIPESIRHRIFEPFFTTKPQGKGTGQGLAISYGVIVDKHQGTIDVDSRPGRGTQFTIKLPIRAPDAIAA